MSAAHTTLLLALCVVLAVFNLGLTAAIWWIGRKHIQRMLDAWGTPINLGLLDPLPSPTPPPNIDPRSLRP